MTDIADGRFAFGQNWKDFVGKHYSDERLKIASDHLLAFLGKRDLVGMSVLDIGSGSGLHSLAAFAAGADRIVSFDYDPDSVATTRLLHAKAGAPTNWTILQGSALDRDFIAGLGRFDLVYSWGVLHHTGDLWGAVRNLEPAIGRPGIVYLALYATEAYVDPTPEYWLATKQRYNRAGWVTKRLMEAHYAWSIVCHRKLGDLIRLPRMARDYRASRGMALHTDIKDWLGGWPMEFSAAHEVVQVCHDSLGLEPAKIGFGDGNTEFLFTTPGDSDRLGYAEIPTRSGAIAAIRRWDALQPRPGQAPVWIYGAGAGGRVVLANLQRMGVPVAGFIDSVKSGTLEGLPVRQFNAFAAEAPRETPIAVTHIAVLETLLRHRFETLFDFAAGMDTLKRRLSPAKLRACLRSANPA